MLMRHCMERSSFGINNTIVLNTSGKLSHEFNDVDINLIERASKQCPSCLLSLLLSSNPILKQIIVGGDLAESCHTPRLSGVREAESLVTFFRRSLH